MNGRIGAQMLSVVLGQVLEQLCSRANSTETHASSSNYHLPEIEIDANRASSTTLCDRETLASQMSQELKKNHDSNLDSTLKHSILYEHLLKDISPAPKNTHSPAIANDSATRRSTNTHSVLKNGKLVNDNLCHNSNNTHFNQATESVSKKRRFSLKGTKAKCPKVNGAGELGAILSKPTTMNLSTKSKFSNNDDDVSVPLNLSVKKAAAAASTSSSSSTSANEANNKLVNNSSKMIVNNLFTSNRQALSHPLFNQQSSSSASPNPQQKKRGRKPKALQSNNNAAAAQFLNFPGFASVANNFLSSGPFGPVTHTSTPNNAPTAEVKPRKRGRPPTLSPPHNSMQPMAAHGSTSNNHGKANSSSGAFSSQYPFNLFNTPELVSSWPGLNALTAAAAAAAAAAAGSPFSNSQNPFNLFKQFNAKDINNFNLNLLNSNLFNLKNLPAQDNEFMNAKAPKIERRAATKEESTSQSTSKNASNNSPKSSYAHKPHPNDKQMRIPLNHGWKRLTFVNGFSKVGTIEGDVQYIAPCGKKIKNYPELIKYLTKNAITFMSRENFSFDTNIIVGQFIQNIQEYGSEVLLTESQIRVQLEDIQMRNFGIAASTSSSNQLQAQNHLLPEKKRRVRDSGGSRNVYDGIKNFKGHKNLFDGNLSKNDFEPSITITTVQGSQRGTKRKNHEQSKAELLRAEKMMKKQEEERQLRELKERQEEERKLKEAQERQLELQKQEQLKVLAEIERERTNQHQMFIHALTELQAAEERELKKEIVAQEKRAIHERKQIKRGLELELVKEMKKPTEDMMLKDLKDLPTFNRIPGLKLTGKAFADSLMVFEFLCNFGETIGFDTDSLPSLNTLMMALLNLDQEAEEELMSIIVHLVVCAIEDPGMPTNMTTTLGQKLKDANVTAHNLTEILRLYFFSFNSIVSEEDRPKRVECQIYDLLGTGIPFLAMNATNKLSILVFLCNELLCNQAIVKQIDENIESATSFKRDKWMLENDIRKLKLVKMKRERITELENAKNALAEMSTENETADSEVEDTTTSTAAIVTSMPPPSVIPEFEDDVSMTNEEIDKKVDRLNKQCTNMNNKVNRALSSYRVFPLGQDRYRRTYWLLPSCGGVFIEAMESCEPWELNRNISKKEDEEEDNEVPQEVHIVEKVAINGVAKSENIKSEPGEDENSEPHDEDSKSNCSLEQREQLPNDDTVKTESALEDGEKSVGSPSAKPTKEEACDTPSNDEDDVKKPSEEKEKAKDAKESEVEDMKWFDLSFSYCEHTRLKESDETTKPELEEEMLEEETCELQPNDTDSKLYRQLEVGLETFLDEQTLQCLFGFVDQDEDAAILKDSLIRLLAPFPESCTIDKFPNSDVGENETTVCLNLQKRIQAWKSVHFGIPQKIDREFQLGWWRITDPTQLKSLIELFHGSALRERNLQKHMEKHLNHAMQSCKSTAANLEVNDFDRELSQSREHGAPTENKCPHKECNSKGYCLDVATSKDIQVLELIEAFEEKILASSMQMRNWKPSAKMTSADFKLKLTPLTTANNSWSKNGKSSKSKKKSKASDSVESDLTENGTGESTNLSNGNGEDTSEEDLLVVQIDKLLEVEASIERRYLKPPLGFKNSNMLANSSNSELANGTEDGEYPAEENAPAGLLRWRDAVQDACCSSQVAMCLHFLENSIAWDKSIMRASCQFCGSGENEAHLLLCDLCDKGYHMYCFKPKMESVPTGDWYCFDCQNKNTIDKVCIVCGKKGKLLHCDTCAKAFHPNCIDPPMTKQLKGKWVCHLCQRKNKRYSGNSKSVSKKSNLNVTIASEERPTESSSVATPNQKESKRISNGNGKDKSDKKGKKERKSKTNDDKEMEKSNNGKKAESSPSAPAPVIVSNDVQLCRQLVGEMEQHPSGWPFLEPVNTKQFPTYKKIIKRPMDLTIIKCKFDSNSYQTKADFAADIRLMFDNCVIFNEDESPVGQAGHNLRAFFETRWDELFPAIV